MLIEKIGLQPLLRLPAGLREALFAAHSQLDCDSKLVLGVLYYLHQEGRLHRACEELPVQTCLGRSQCEACLKKLARLNLIEYTGAEIDLRIKPLPER